MHRERAIYNKENLPQVFFHKSKNFLRLDDQWAIYKFDLLNFLKM